MQSTVYANAKAAAASELAPEPVAFDSNTGIMITRYIAGGCLSVDSFKGGAGRELLAHFVAVVRRLHASNVQFVDSRAADVLRGYPIEGMKDLLSSGAVPSSAFKLQDLLARCLGTFEPIVGCHNDLTPTNCIVASSGRTFLIDWEWSGPFDVVHDLSKLVLLCELGEPGENEVLELYFGRQAVTPIHRCRMKLWLLHTMSREALWCLAKAKSPIEQGVARGYDYVKEGQQFAEEYAAKLELPETAALMAQLEAALVLAGH